MTKSPAILLAVAAAVTVAGCGAPATAPTPTATANASSATPSVRVIANATQLKDEAVAAGFSCPAWKAIPQSVEGRTEGQCAEDTLFVVMEAADARKEFTDKMKSTEEASNILWGENWAIYASPEELEKVRARIGGTMLATPKPTPMPSEETSVAAEPTDEASTGAEAATSDAPEAPASSAPEVPTEYVAALEKAQSYVAVMHPSKKGLYAQLTSSAGEGFEPKAAHYAVDHVEADWSANALAKAQEYQSVMHMSRSAIREQLTSSAGEQFTAAEADYAIKHLA